MTTIKPGDTQEDILRELTGQAVRRFGEARARALADELNQTARQLWEIDQVTPGPDLEPGFYQ